jgi:hypothetical protein
LTAARYTTCRQMAVHRQTGQANRIGTAELSCTGSRRRRCAPPRPDAPAPGVRPGGRSRRSAPGSDAFASSLGSGMHSVIDGSMRADRSVIRQLSCPEQESKNHEVAGFFLSSARPPPSMAVLRACLEGSERAATPPMANARSANRHPCTWPARTGRAAASAASNAARRWFTALPLSRVNLTSLC